MTKPTGVTAAILWLAAVLVGIASSPALGQGKKGESTIKEIQQNDRVRVYEVIYQPGDVSPSLKRPMRVIHALKGGKLERTYDDGKKEVSEWKTGETRIISEERAYAVKNIGKGVVHLFIVALK
jgi:hypothetical protein